MTSLTRFVERRSTARLRETPLRRRNGQVRRAVFRSGTLPGTPELRERRKSSDEGFNVAATLELNLDRFPTKPAMLTFLTALLSSAEAGDLGFRQANSVDALRQAVDFMEHSAEPIEAVATLQGYQSYVARTRVNGSRAVAPQRSPQILANHHPGACAPGS